MPQVDDANPATDTTRYLHRDHLGSIVAITDEAGALAERLSYDAHGKRRLADWLPSPIPLAAQSTPRGFTGHEHLDGVGLIHMNGRVYDPIIGRFLSADPFIQFPKSTQGLNRYTYVNNNPLSFTDPSGYIFGRIFRSIGRAIRGAVRAVGRAVRGAVSVARRALQNQVVDSILHIVGTAAAFTLGGPFGPYTAAGFSAAFSAITTAAHGGGLGDIAMSAGIAFASAVAFHHIGARFGTPKFLRPGHIAKILAHGVVGGAFNRLRGGRFVAGFLASAFTQFAAPVIGIIPRDGAGIFAHAAAAAVAGGKFRNGAITGAFSRLYNDEWEEILGRRVAQSKLDAAQRGRSPGIYLTGLRVYGGPYHLAIEYVPVEGDVITLSAGSSGLLLVSDINRSTDAANLNVTLGTVTPPASLSPEQYFDLVVTSDSFYCDCLNYDISPSGGAGYNSDGFVSGIIRATHGIPSINLGDFVGGQHPLPYNSFHP